MAHAGGRPPKLTEAERAEVLEAFKLYIDRTPDPTVVGFVAYDSAPARLFVTRDNLNDWPEFSTLQKYCIEKQEAYLLQAGGTGRYNPTMAIFRLKQPQHGYRDRFETDVTTAGEKIEGSINASQLDQLIRARAERSDT